ncbi:techylectin-5A-like [Oratosquilla oratoria]|uniref:techylectin-5A-like n=1 Tax=Oratosquilla oratoria TaxID=337810 RepID=UPI003F771863
MLWLILHLLLGRAIAASVVVDPSTGKDQIEDSKYITVPDRLIDALTKCSDQVVTLSGHLVTLSTHACSTVFSAGGSKASEVGHQPLSTNSNHKHIETSSGFPPLDCHDLLLLGYNTSGVYSIHPSRCQRNISIRVHCDMETAGGGWTNFLVRKEQTPQENFTRSWGEYADGFGDPEKEYWLGNDILHSLTSNRRYALRVDMEDWEGSRRWAEYENFFVDSRESLYTLTVTGYKGDAGNDLEAYHSGHKFSTPENDNDVWDKNCALTYKGGWWYGECHRANPTGLYLRGNHEISAIGVNWHSFKGHKYSLMNVNFKIRPKDCPNIKHHTL